MRYPLSAGNWLTPKSNIFTDQILERRENEYWRWTIYDFKMPALFFAKSAVGEWWVAQHPSGGWQVTYRYTFQPSHAIWRPLTWLFVRVQWSGMMRKAMQGIKKQAESRAPYVYETRL